MSRGIGYKYKHFLLFDDEIFNVSEDEFDDYGWLIFKKDLCKAFNAKLYPVVEHIAERGMDTIYLIGESNKAKIGIDYTGDMPCVFLIPIEYKTDKFFLLEKVAKEGFNKMIKNYPEVFMRPTSCWTCELVKKYA
jgi:hypothetical protein